MKTFELDKVNLESTVTVYSLNCSGQLRRRFLDFGICKGTLITPLFRSINSDSTAYLVRGSTIAIRKDDAKNIKIQI